MKSFFYNFLPVFYLYPACDCRVHVSFSFSNEATSWSCASLSQERSTDRIEEKRKEECDQYRVFTGLASTHDFVHLDTQRDEKEKKIEEK